MNFYKAMNDLNAKYQGTDHAPVLEEATWVFVDFLRQIECQLRRKQQANQTKQLEVEEQ